MRSLSQAKLEKMLAFTLELHSTLEPRGVIDKMIDIASDLVPCPAVAYNEIDLEARTANVVHNFSAEADPLLPLMAEFIHENPIIIHHPEHPDAATKFSDFTTRREFRRTNFYNAFLRPLELETQLAIWVRSIPDKTVTLSLQRGTKDFTEEDRSVLETLAPHFRLALINAAKFQDLKLNKARVATALEHIHAGVVFVDSAGKMTYTTDYADKCLRWFFGYRQGRGLPDMVASWLKARNATEARNLAVNRLCPLIVQNERGRLTVRATTVSFEKMLLLTHEPPPSAAALNKLGLTRREYEILFWISEGKSDAAIGKILSISTRTTQKHVENIRRKLNVESRSAAARILLDSIS